MVNYDTESAFIQLKSDKSEDFYLAKCMVAGVIGMTKGRYAKERLDELLFKVVDETMKQVFREEGAKTIYVFLENNSHLKLEEIAEKPEAFSAGLERLMVSAARVIENLILKNLYRKLGLKFEEKKGYEFSDYVRKLKKGFGG